MATYTAVSTFKRDWWPRGTDTNQGHIQAAATTAKNIIDAKLGKCYAVPFTTATTSGNYPGIVVSISDLLTKILVEYLMEKGRLPTVQIIEEKALINPLAMLQEIVDGDAEVIDGDDTKLGRLTTTGAWVPSHQKDYRPIFEIDDDLDQYASEDLIDALEDWRET
jgi:hypothetical protein